MISAALVLATVAAAGACGSGSSGAAGAGEDIDVCEGYRVYDSLEEPNLDRPAEVGEHAEAVIRVMERTRVDYPIRNRTDQQITVPAEVTEDLATIRQSMTKLREAVSNAGDDRAKTRLAVERLATETGFNKADADMADYVARTCRP